MALPLTPSSNATLNIANPTNTTPSTNCHLDEHEVKSHSTKMTSEHVTSDGDAAITQTDSPTNSNGNGNKDNTTGHNQENVSPSKSRHSRIMSGNELSPLKILITKDEKSDTESRPSHAKISSAKSPRKVSPEKRFPVKVNSIPSPSPSLSPEVQTPPVKEREISIEEALLHNQGLANAIKIFEDEDTMLETGESGEGADVDITALSVSEQPVDDEPSNPDDTMISTFSEFSAVPNMTMFARIGHSPTKFANVGSTPTTLRTRPEPSPSRTPRPPVIHESGNTTSLLVDFTEQINGLSSSRYVQQTPSRNQASGRNPINPAAAATPQRRQSNLLDFDIPPLPTPRSIPTITPRELESLKSGFLSEISGLKASLSGKEAEVSSLKTAVGDAEKRVGVCMEELREIRVVKETLAEDRDNWEKRSQDMEDVLRKVKEEILMGQREREELESKLEESEKRREAAEMMAQEAESKMAGMRAGKATSDSGSELGGIKSPDKTKNPGSREVEIAVERVARELHALYKSKHETKVAALKKSYENRWEKRVRELEYRVDELSDENEKLRLGRDATMTKVDPNQSIIDEERKAQAVKDSAQIKELNAEIEKLEAVINSVKLDNHDLRQLLEKERVEKGELVMLAEEMMSMQPIAQPEEMRPPPPRPSMGIPRAQTAGHENFRSSVGNRASGLRAPNSVKKPTDSRIGGIAGIAHDRSKHGGSHGGIPRPGSGMGTRSGIMSSIEKMGSYRGRGE